MSRHENFSVFRVRVRVWVHGHDTNTKHGFFSCRIVCSFGKHTYSQQKNLHLLKMMMCTTTTGYIVETFGPYLANGANNDANIMKDIFDDENHIRKFFKMEDIFIVDRGFRDSLDFLNSLGVETQT